MNLFKNPCMYKNLESRRRLRGVMYIWLRHLYVSHRNGEVGGLSYWVFLVMAYIWLCPELRHFFIVWF